MIPSSSNWSEPALKAVSADYDPKRDHEAEMDPAGSIIGSPVSKLDWGSFQKGDWPIEPIPKEYRKLQYSDAETLNAIWTYVLALVFGIIIFIFPAIVAYLVALLLVVFGLAGILRSVRKK